MLSCLSRSCRAVFYFIEARFNSVFGENNPFYHLGDLGFLFFFIMFFSGTYLFVYYDPTISGSYDQLQYLTREQWYLGGIMRSLHRYAADGMVLAMALHILRELVMGRFRGARRFSWITGVPVLIMVYFTGIVGFWMVWDQLGQFIAVRTSEWLDWLPVFASPMARNFLTNADVTDPLFRLLIIVHIGLPLFLFMFLLLHIKKISRARILPPRALMLGTLGALVLLALIQPAISSHRADLAVAPGILHPDWFYMFFYPLMQFWSMGAVWAALAAVIALFLLLPWLPGARVRPAATVDLDYCSGCGLCADDCPYEAIVMRGRSDGHPLFLEEASVITDNCVRCGICTGACPSSNPFRRNTIEPLHRTGALKSGIEMPQHNVEMMRRQMDHSLTGGSRTGRILLVGCEHGAEIETHAEAGVALLRIPCIGMLPPAFIEHALRQGAAGVLLAGCRKGDCYHRFGGTWLSLRLDNQRRPMLRHSVDRSRIGLCWASPTDQQHLHSVLKALRQSLRG